MKTSWTTAAHQGSLGKSCEDFRSRLEAPLAVKMTGLYRTTRTLAPFVAAMVTLLGAASVASAQGNRISMRATVRVHENFTFVATADVAFTGIYAEAIRAVLEGEQGGTQAEGGVEGAKRDGGRPKLADALANLWPRSFGPFELVGEPRVERDGAVRLVLRGVPQEAGWQGYIHVVSLPVGFATMAAVLPPELLDVVPRADRVAREPGVAAEPAPALAAAAAETYTWRVPAALDVAVRVELPDGFRPRALPQKRERAVGGTVLRREVRREGERAVLATLSLLTGPTHMSAANHQELRQELASWAAELALPLELELSTEILRETGDLTKAVTDGRRLVGSHPEVGAYHTQLALAYLTAGLVEAAKREAKRGVELSPNDAFAYQILAYVLEHDGFATRFGLGFEREEALRVRRQFLQLSPTGWRAPLELARLLSFDGYKGFLPAGAPLKEIIALSRRAVEAGAGKQGLELLLPALGEAGRFSEIERELRETPPGADNPSTLIAAIAAARGGAAARSELGRLSTGEERSKAIVLEARRWLHDRRRYAEAADLAEATADLSGTSAAQVKELRALGRHEELKLDAGDPRATLRQLLVGCVGRMVLAPEARTAVVPRLMELASYRRADARAGTKEAYPLLAICQGFSPFLVVATHTVDRLLGGQIEQTGNRQQGFRLVVRPFDGSKSSERVFFFSTRDGRLQLAGWRPGDAAVEALRLAGVGRTADAAVWAEWGKDLWLRQRPNFPMSRLLRAIGSGPGGHQPDSPILAAWVLAAELESTADRVAALQGAFEAESRPAVRWDLACTIAVALSDLRKDDEALAWHAKIPTAGEQVPTDLAHVRIWLLRRARRFAEARVAAAALGKSTDDLQSVRLQLGIADQAGDTQAALAATSQIVADQRATAADWNNHAWFLFSLGRGAEVLDAAKRATEGTGETPSSMHTLAAVQAASGLLREARTTLQRMLKYTGSFPSPDAWVVIGQIAEGLQLREDAINAYRRVPESVELFHGTSSPYDFAARRLAALTAARR
jgi:tetratricopeptide (TPR) repeat protein